MKRQQVPHMQLAELVQRIAAALALHDDDGDGYCGVCCTPGPCATVRALTGGSA